MAGCYRADHIDSGKAINSSPANGAIYLGITSKLSWIGDVKAISHDVYFGTNPTPGPDEFKGNQGITSYDPGTLANNTTYYWRIDEKGQRQTIATGDVWSFTTVDNTPDPDMVGWWKFNETSGTTAYDSAKGNNGTLNNGPTWASGISSGALSFDGINDYLNVPDNSNLTIASGGITISAWVKFTAMPSYQLILAKKDGSYDSYRLSTNGSHLEFLFYNSSYYGNSYRTTNANLTSGTWYHIVLTHTFGTGSSIKIYLNDVLINGYWTHGGNDLPITVSGPVLIGGFTYTGGPHLNGIMDDVQRI